MTPPLLCEVIAARTMTELRAKRDAARDADLVELRLDLVDRPDVHGALDGRRKPVIVTCRPTWEGGQFRGSEEERQLLLRQAFEAGAEYVDVEWSAKGVERWMRREDLDRLILSTHDFAAVPRDLDDRVDAMRARGAAIVKVAVAVKSLREVTQLLRVGRRQSSRNRTVLIGMGMAGIASRILPGHFGSCWTYAGAGFAPGQISGGRLLREFRFRAVTSSTQIYAIVGKPVGHSLSPAMHNAGFGATGVDAVYLPCEAVDFDDFLALADELPIAGASVTAPFKRDACDMSTSVEEDARAIQAANAIRRTPDGWAACNTDIAGFLQPLRALGSTAGQRAAVLGTGGAARAIIAGLQREGAHVTVHGRRPEAVAELVALTGATAGPWPPAPRSWDLLVNTTTVGLFPSSSETPFSGPFDGRLVYDTLYNPRPTRLLREAAAAGCQTIDGLGMLVSQAIDQFRWWTGQTPSAELFHRAALRRLEEMSSDGVATEISAGAAAASDAR